MIKNKESKPKRKRSCFRLPDELKLEVAKERHLERKSTSEIAKEHGISLTSVDRILRIFVAANQSDGDSVGANKNQSHHGRLTTRISPIVLTCQLGTVVRRKTDNPN